MGWTDAAAVVPIAERAALAAIRADSDDPWARHALGCVHLISRRFDHALAEQELALSLNPNFALAQSIYGLILSFFGRWEDAYTVVTRALRLSPRDPLSALYNGIAAYAQFVGAQLRGGDAAGAREHPSSRRLRRWPPRALCGRRHGRTGRHRRFRIA